jgi:hypothetical protein
MFLGLVYSGVFLFGDNNYFSGRKTFSTIAEAQAYQSQILNEAVAVGAKVTQCDITVTSPPTLTYVVALHPHGRGYTLPSDYYFMGQVAHPNKISMWVVPLAFGAVLIGIPWAMYYD